VFLTAFSLSLFIPPHNGIYTVKINNELPEYLIGVGCVDWLFISLVDQSVGGLVVFR